MRVALHLPLHLRQVHSGAQPGERAGERLLVHLRAANHEDGLHLAGEFRLVEGRESGLQGARERERRAQQAVGETRKEGSEQSPSCVCWVPALAL